MKRLQNFFLLTAFIVASSACSIQPPDDQDQLGPEVSAADIESAKAAAQAGVTQSQAYKVGDNGTVQVVDHVLSNSSVAYTDDYAVVSIDANYIYFTDFSHETGHTTNYEIPRDASQSLFKSKVGETIAQLLGFLPRPLFEGATRIYSRITTFFSSVEIQPSSALGESAERGKSNILGVNNFTPLYMKLDTNLDRVLLSKGLQLAASSPTPTPTVAASPTPVPSAAPTATPSLSHFYGLKVAKHRFTTPNCAQIPDCQVDATRIEYNEISANPARRIHWLYEISNQVPGLFMFMQVCFSTLLTQGTSQIPFQRCQVLQDFRYGS